MRTIALIALAACGRVGFDGSTTRDATSADGAVIDGMTADAIAIDGVPATWWDPAWTKRIPISIDNSQLVSDLVEFPVLVRLPPSFDYASARADGRDLRFVVGNGSLAHDVERFAVGSESLIWVSVPIIAAPPNPPPQLYLYYGNPNGSVLGANVWAAWTSVHHLVDLGDATGNGHVGTVEPGENLPFASTGVVGGAMSFQGNEATLLAGEAAYDFTGPMSISAWVSVISVDHTLGGIICKGDSSWRIEHSPTASGLEFARDTGSSAPALVASRSILGNAWHHVAIEFDGNTERLYVDGILDATNGTTATTNVNNSGVAFGDNEESPQNRLFHGAIDEVRIGPMVHGSSWIGAEYGTVTDSSFAIVGAVETL